MLSKKDDNVQQINEWASSGHLTVVSIENNFFLPITVVSGHHSCEPVTFSNLYVPHMQQKLAHGLLKSIKCSASLQQLTANNDQLHSRNGIIATCG